jgi:hypothetical protein
MLEKLALKCLGRVGTQLGSTNKTEIQRLTQGFYFIRKETVWDNSLGIMSHLLYPCAMLPENSLALARETVKLEEVILGCFELAELYIMEEIIEER